MLEKDFIQKNVKKFQEGILKDFPNDFLSGNSGPELKLPEKALMLGSELFGSYEISDSKGNPFYQSENYQRIKYLLYANRKTPASVVFPEDDKVIEQAVKEYEGFIDSLVADLEKDFKKEFPDSKSFMSVSNQIFGKLNLKRF